MRHIVVGCLILLSISCATLPPPRQLTTYRPATYSIHEMGDAVVLVSTMEVRRKTIAVYSKPMKSAELPTIPDFTRPENFARFQEFRERQAWLLFELGCGRATCTVKVYERQRVGEITTTPYDIWIFTYGHPSMPRENVREWWSAFLRGRYQHAGL